MGRRLTYLIILNLCFFSQMISAQSGLDFPKLKEKAKTQFVEGNYSKAISLAEAAIELYTDLFEDKDSLYASFLSDLALYKYYGGTFEEAISLEKEALLIKTTVTPDDIKGIANSYNHLCAFYGDAEDFEKAFEYGQRSIRLLKTAGIDGERYIEALESLGLDYVDAGKLDDAKSLFEEAIPLLSKYDLDYSYLSGELYTSLGYLYEEYGFCEKALGYALKGQAIFIKVLGDEHPEYSYTLHTLGIIYSYMGDYHAAEEAMIKCVQIREKAFGMGHKYHIRSLINLGSLYEDMGNYDLSINIFEQALALLELTEGKDNSNYTYVLFNIADNYAVKGNYKKAIEIQSKVVALEKKILGIEHPYYAKELLYLSDYYRKAQDYQKAISLGEEALSLVRSDYSGLHLFYRYLADYYSESGELVKAIEYIDISLSLLKKYEGTGTIAYQKALRSKLAIYNKANILALNDVIEYDELLRGLIIHNFANMTSYQRNQLWFTNREWFSTELPRYATSLNSDMLSIRLYNDVLLTKGITLNSAIEFNKQVLEANNPELKETYEDLQGTSQLITSLLQLPIAERYVSVDSLYNRRNILEKQLITDSQVYGNYMRNLELNWTDIQSSLKERDVAIEFIDFPTQKGEQMYYAILIRKHYNAPVLIRLCSSSEINDASRTALYTSASLYNLIWAPLIKEFDNVDRVFFSPTGQLFNIAIEYLAAGFGRDSMMDKYELYRLSSTRQIALAANRNKSVQSQGAVYAFGGIDYDTSPQTNRDETSLIRGGFDYLPATKNEVEIIKSKLKNRFKVITFIGLDATETEVKQLSGKTISCLHIATHGFYWTSTDIKREHLDYSFIHTESDFQISEEELVLSHSGLLFAGANKTLRSGSDEQAGDDGILTSNEISNLDLSNVNLLVLSACKTGLGDINSNEVYGLQRGFKSAGVNTIIMSMWEVDDNATSLLMNKFYEVFYRTGSPVQSLKEAQNYVRNYSGTVRLNGDNVRVDYSNPKYWAAFIVLDGLD